MCCRIVFTQMYIPQQHTGKDPPCRLGSPEKGLLVIAVSTNPPTLSLSMHHAW